MNPVTTLSSSPVSLSDGDAATVSDLSAHRRAAVSVADANAAYRAELVTDYIAARRTGVWFDELRLLAEARRYDVANPDDSVPLFDELHAIELFGAQPAGVAA
ncbi:hypothetical protein ACFYMO_03805 [Streptomyces sp. NPDC007025]|uniref:hypothetical protein n=1 Tax=Streptomyces sp. NPDC007025 TaxID=3364771 RepID=UPI00367E4906